MALSIKQNTCVNMNEQSATEAKGPLQAGLNQTR